MARYERKVSKSRLARAARGSWQARIVTVVALGWAKLWRATIRFDDEWNIYVCSGMKGGFGRGGTTYGGTYLTNTKTAFHTLRHEAVHADQWARYGFAFAVLYLIEEARHRGPKNKYEIEAGLEDGGYTKRL